MAITPTPRRSPAERRGELLDAARTLSEAHGIDRLTVRDIARTVGVTTGLVHHYFPTVDDLVVAVFVEATEEDLRRQYDTLDERTPLDAMQQYFARSVSPERDEALTIWLGAWVAASRRPGLRGAVERMMNAGAERLEYLIRAGAASGEFTCADPAMSAQRILVVTDGIMIQRALGLENVERLGLFAMIRETIEQELGIELLALDRAQ